MKGRAGFVGVVLVVAVACLCLAPGASARVIGYQGKTDQERRVFVKSTPKNVVKKVKLNWKPRCPAHPNRAFATTTLFIPPLTESRRGAFRDEGPYRIRDKRYRIRARVKLVGHKATPTSWRGTFSGRYTVKRKSDGSVYARCSLDTEHWRTHKQR